MKKTGNILLFLGMLLLSGSCKEEKQPISTYCANFKALIRPDSILPVLSPDFHMSMDSLGQSIQARIGGDTCGRVWVSIPLSTGDTLPVSIPYPICYTGPTVCVFHQALFSIELNKKAQVLINGDSYALHELAQQVPKAKILGHEYSGGFIEINYDSKAPSDSVYQLLQEVVALYYRRYESLSEEMYQVPFCTLPQKELQAIRELHPFRVYLIDERSIPPPPPPPMLDSL